MMPDLPEYEHFIYSLPDQLEFIKASTLIVKRTSRTSAQVVGTLYFEKELILSVLQTVDFFSRRIVDYSYEVYQGPEKLYWYDCWPHPDDPSLLSTFPHHKHVPPDLKRHRIPAENMSFEQPNLPRLTKEIEELVVTL